MSAQMNLSFFDNIYNNTYDTVLKYVICKCSNLDDVNDIVQDTYLELYKILQKNNKLLINDINAFIIGIAKNKVKQYWGVKYKNQNLEAFSKDDSDIQMEIADDAILENIVLTNDDIGRVKEFVKKEKPATRKIFYLYYYFDMSLDDIANEMDMNISTVKSRLYRLIKELTIYFKKEVMDSE